MIFREDSRYKHTCHYAVIYRIAVGGRRIRRCKWETRRRKASYSQLSPPVLKKRAKRSERSGAGGRLSRKRACVISGGSMVTSPPKEMCVSFIATGPVTG